MKLYPYTIQALSLLLLLFSCQEQNPPYYDCDANGIQFGYPPTELNRTLNFANFLVGYPESVPVKLKVSRLGYLLDEEVTFALKVGEGDAKPLARVELPELVTLAPREYEKEVELRVFRPEEANTTYAVQISFDLGNPVSNISSGVQERSTFLLRVVESYTKPSDWGNSLSSYLGNWDVEKHKFVANVLEDNRYTHVANPDRHKDFNLRVVAEIRRQKEETPSKTFNFSIPFHTRLTYPKPFYWGEKHDNYLGEYTEAKFKDFQNTFGRKFSPTNEYETLAGNGDDNKLKDLNKRLVRKWMEKTNEAFADFGFTNAKSKVGRVPFFPSENYAVEQPSCWQDWDSMKNVKLLIEKYYGSYSEAKYKFMLRSWAEYCEQEHREFNIWDMFPVTTSPGNGNIKNSSWDESIGGENQIRHCYDVLKAKYDAAPQGTYSFTFPEKPQK